jgi:hypothetical protein
MTAAAQGYLTEPSAASPAGSVLSEGGFSVAEARPDTTLTLSEARSGAKLQLVRLRR